ncbi:MAG: helix-turn-helix domain-containing protein [Erythrobacter sp.]|nr:helix-turn-helix domain-containing protein [Erythrobacter sp.]
MIFLDALLRFGGLGLLVAIAVASWRYRKDWPSAPYLILACVSVSALFLGYSPPELRPPEPLFTLVRFLDIPHLVFVWLFALSLYERDFTLRAWHVIVGFLYAGPIFWPRLAALDLVADQPDWLPVYGGISSIALIGHLVWVTLGGRGDDLVESRRSSRTYFVVLLFVVTILAAASELLPRDGPIDHRTAKVLAILPALAFGASWMLRFDLPKTPPDNAAAAERALSARDRALLPKLRQHVFEKEAFRDPTITIVSLAAVLGVSQHRLRGLVNDGLGYTNFSTFINRARIEAVCEAMEQDDTADLPILTLAIDAGFKSLSSFNKAFKAVHGMTPSSYRRMLSENSGRARNPSAISTNPQDARMAGI